MSFKLETTKDRRQKQPIDPYWCFLIVSVCNLKREVKLAKLLIQIPGVTAKVLDLYLIIFCRFKLQLLFCSSVLEELISTLKEHDEEEEGS